MKKSLAARGATRQLSFLAEVPTAPTAPPSRPASAAAMAFLHDFERSRETSVALEEPKSPAQRIERTVAELEETASEWAMLFVGLTSLVKAASKRTSVKSTRKEVAYA